MDWINLAEDTYNVTDFMNMAVNVQVPWKYREFFWLAEEPVVSQEGLCCVQAGVQLVQLVYSWCAADV